MGCRASASVAFPTLLKI